MVQPLQSLFLKPDISDEKPERGKTSSLVKHITDTVNASVTFVASLSVAFAICYVVITLAIILSLLKSLINLFSCRKSTPSVLSKPVRLSPSRTKPVLTQYSFYHDQKVLSSLPPPEPVVGLSLSAPRNALLPESSKKTLFLSLRRVLVKYSFNPPHDQFDVFVVFPLIKGIRRACYVLKRPGLDELLRAAKIASFEVVIYTRGLSEFAGPIIDMLDPTEEFITHRLYQNACTNMHRKDLVTTGRKLDRSVIIDDNPRKHVKQWSNAIAVRPFLGDQSDTDLINLLKFFEVERNFTDLRQLINIMSFSPAALILPLPSTDKKTLFLDLDQTLIYASTKQPSDRNYFVNEPYFIVKRPGVEELLRAAHWASFEIVIFTAASAGYASPILDWLDPSNKYITHRLYRDACTAINEGCYEKDLTTTGRRLEWSVIIDDSPKLVRPQENAIAMRPFKGDSSDRELLNLLWFFDVQSRFNDIRITAKYVNDLHHAFSNQRKKHIDGTKWSNCLCSRTPNL
ncbi:NLI interacting factor-like phosphatase [Carex littledalei]|uniref:Mitochondrial import inner membrane translocase subunit TIM50 n=1 Tax=Carex littledalei TaxID=544730 RepID=A0A833VAU1_9POAL|nr:NLI interacting factor-like phosphatase [Carex littledalei]